MFNIDLTPIDKSKLVDSVNKFALEPLDPNSYEIFKATMSNQNLDSHGTKMHPTTLKRYTDTINKNSVPLMLHHNDQSLPVGRLFKSEINGESNQVFYYIQKDLELGGQKTNDLIEAQKGGTIRDVSVGFRVDDQSTVNCSICDTNILTDECKHRMGRSYDSKRAFLWIKNADVREMSLVYKGSTPGAKVDSYVRSDGSVFEIIKERKMGINWTQLATDFNLTFGELDDQSRFELVINAVEKLKPQLSELETLRAQVKDLEVIKLQAEDGRKYRADLVQEAKAAKVRAFGSKFSADDYEKVLMAAPLEYIRGEIALYNEQVKQVFGDGSRPTNQIREKIGNATSQSLDRIYKV